MVRLDSPAQHIQIIGPLPPGEVLGGWHLDIRFESVDEGVCASCTNLGGAPGFMAGAPRLGSRTAALDYARSLPAEPSGSLIALFLGRKFELLAMDRLGSGSLAGRVPKPLLLVRRGLELGAVGMVLVHRSPGIGPESRARLSELRRAGDDYEVHLLDYLVLAAADAGSA